nr:GMC oxidoreductase [Bradyrhizobium paxllaeri]
MPSLAARRRPAAICVATFGWTVVDDQLHVRRLQELRVVDASIMSRMISANLNASTLMFDHRAVCTFTDKPVREFSRRSAPCLSHCRLQASKVRCAHAMT